ncbi:MAG TPA: DegT/DnrJ/EryC1/StrS family aminotransferase [Opitutaceae bacterium]|nr:DegT/DnrJ/EryC1/StrS family aminotransferase [Opitutaceae bacterium]
MIARKRLDLGWSDLAFAVAACAGITRAPRTNRPLLSRRADGLVCLSVRSGFDLLLGEVAWPAGSEVIVSAITIPDIPRILREHGLVPVPVDVDPETLAVDEAMLARVCSPRTRAIVIAHLFGALSPMEGIVALARERGLMVVEDCAQAFTADEFVGDERSDVRMFSFGPIKTATALGGGILLVRDPALLGRLRARQASWPQQRTTAFLRRVLKLGFFKPLVGSWIYGGLVALLRGLGRNHDEIVTRAGRGFVGGNFFQRLRHRPCVALVALLERRLASYDPARIAARASAGERLRAALRGVRPLGADAARRTHWLFPLRVAERETLMRELWAAGFDATSASSSLYALPAEPGQEPARAAEAAMASVLYVPAYAEMSASQLDTLAAKINLRAKAPAPLSPVSPR